MERHPSARDSKIVQIALAYDEGDDVEEIVNGLVERADVGLSRRGAVTDQAPLILAGGISSQLLAAGLAKWLRGLKDVSIYVSIRARSNRVEISKGDTPGRSEIVVVGRDGTENNLGASVGFDDLANAIEDASE